MSIETPEEITAAQAIVAEMIARLKTLVEASQQHLARITSELRQAERALDEVAMQHRFAVENHLPTVHSLAAREEALRKTHQQLTHAAQAYQRASKQLDQLIRQIEMSSTTLDGSSEGETSDPWIQALRAQVILGREEERVRLAREVHDSPAQVLANTLIGLEKSCALLQQQRIQPLGVLLTRLRDATREGLQEVRHFIADLRPGRLAEKGLLVALQEYIQRYRATYNAQVQFELVGTVPKLSREAEIVLYRIVQEALQNAHKHARGAPIHVKLAMHDRKLTLTIRDEGPGFDPREVAQRAGRESWGLTSMRERADMIGARYTVFSRPGQGTEVTVVLPIGDTSTPPHS